MKTVREAKARSGAMLCMYVCMFFMVAYFMFSLISKTGLEFDLGIIYKLFNHAVSSEKLCSAELDYEGDDQVRIGRGLL
jgi:hypothetical protein